MHTKMNIYLFDADPVLSDDTKWNDILDNAQYTIVDEDILSYSWSIQEITFKRKDIDKIPLWMDNSGYFIIEFDGEYAASGRTSHESSPSSMPGKTLYMTNKSYRNNDALTYRLRNNQSPYANPPLESTFEPEMTEKIQQYFAETSRLIE